MSVGVAETVIEAASIAYLYAVVRGAALCVLTTNVV